MMSYKYNGKIGLVKDRDLGIANSNGCHYVYVKRTKTKDKYDVHTITSIENNECDEKHTLPIVIDRQNNVKYIDPNKIRAIRNGNLYAIPYYQTNLSKWSGITKKPIKNIDKSKIMRTDKKIWRRHKFIVGKTYK